MAETFFPKGIDVFIGVAPENREREAENLEFAAPGRQIFDFWVDGGVLYGDLQECSERRSFFTGAAICPATKDFMRRIAKFDGAVN